MHLPSRSAANPISCSFVFFSRSGDPRDLHSFPTRRSSDLLIRPDFSSRSIFAYPRTATSGSRRSWTMSANASTDVGRSEEHTSELQSRQYLVCRLLLEKKKQTVHQRIQTTPTQGHL